jgi:hypothetical protein
VKKRHIYLILFLLCISAIVVLGFIVRKDSTPPVNCTKVGRAAEISPDYNGIVIPPNIAPLNFFVLEPGERYLVKIYSAAGDGFTVSGRKGKIKIPAKKWKALLGKNRGNELFFDIYIKGPDGRWSRFDSVSNIIAKEDIDAYITYRFMTPSSYYPKKMGVYQQNLENCDRQVVFHGNLYNNGCVNCHTFVNNNADKMLIGVRNQKYGEATLLVNKGRVSKIGTKFGYTSWHPSGRFATYSINLVAQFFHLARQEIHDVIDTDSGIVNYMVDSQTVKTTAALSDKGQLETYPAWTPDGKYLYFCSAPMLWQDHNQVKPEDHNKIKYDLKRISYDIQTDKWGGLETVLSADKTGLSILLPRISPDGRFLLFCMCEYGCFPVYEPGSDLYMMNLETGDYKKLDINSEYSESWHSWSSNSRWIAFSSKRQGGLFTRIYLSYVDENGSAYKPFVMPQKDPEFYDTAFKVYSIPELTTGPIKIDPRVLSRAACGPQKIDVDLPITTATPVAGAKKSQPWQNAHQ